MRSAKKAGQDEQQNQTTTTKFKDIHFCHVQFFFKKINNKVKIAHDGTEPEQSNLCFTRNDMESVHDRARLPLDKKKEKKQQG